MVLSFGFGNSVMSWGQIQTKSNEQQGPRNAIHIEFFLRLKTTKRPGLTEAKIGYLCLRKRIILWHRLYTIIIFQSIQLCRQN
jgi:hypothetical protein